MIDLLEAMYKSDSLGDILSTVVDGGSTSLLNFEVETSTPSEAMQLRTDLLTESPWLSDTVMKSAIEKEEVLNNVMIRDVLVANPQSAKRIEVLEALDQRNIPIPDSLMADIMEGENILGQKEVMERNLLWWNQQYGFTLKTLTGLYSLRYRIFVLGHGNVRLGNYNSCFNTLYLLSILFTTGRTH
jgi:hypothetical protein